MMKILNHDIGREKRCGIPEVVFGSGKTTEDMIKIADEFLSTSGRIIITKIDDKKTERILKRIDKRSFLIHHNKKGKVLVIKKKGIKTIDYGVIGLITAGTSDIPVAEEAKAVAEELGCRVITIYDVGIAGIHRLFPALDKVKNAGVLIVIAGMEGALPSIVSGLVSVPVIGVPTSVGYGTGTRGKAALNAMLNSCSPIAVVNIDNGYGAAVLAYKILKYPESALMK